MENIKLEGGFLKRWMTRRFLASIIKLAFFQGFNEKQQLDMAVQITAADELRWIVGSGEESTGLSLGAIRALFERNDFKDVELVPTSFGILGGMVPYYQPLQGLGIIARRRPR